MGRKQLLLSFFCTSMIIVAVVLFFLGGLFKFADQATYDFYFKLRGPLPPSGHVVLVLIDARSDQAMRAEPTVHPRIQLARAIDNLSRAGAEIIGVDLLLSAPAPDSSVDQRLARSIYDSNNVILARVASIQGRDGLDPLPLFQESMIGDGFIDVPLDEDAVLRKIRFLNAKPLADGSLQLLPSLALEVARSYLNISYTFDFSEENSFTMGQEGERQLRLPYPELLINYVGDYHVFPQISYIDVVRGEFAPEKVQGKIILLGSATVLKKDFFVTAFSRFRSPGEELQNKFKELVDTRQSGVDMGVACHANAVETILSGRFIHNLPTEQALFCIFCTGLLGMVCYLPTVSAWQAGVLMLLGGLANFGGGYLALTKYSLWLPTTPFMSVFILQFVTGGLVQRLLEKRRRARVTNLFGKYVSPSIVNHLLADNVEETLEGRRESLTMFFADLRSFTSLSEKLGAQATSSFLNRYFDLMIPIIFRHHGTLDKLMGDAVMAFFGSPVKDLDHPKKAAAAAVEMVACLEQLRREGGVYAEIDMGVGINTGEVTVGNLGSSEFMDYTVIGDAVNIASRLEGLNKVYGTNIIISEHTANLLGETFLLRRLDHIRVKGKKEALVIYELLGEQAAASASGLQMIALFEEGLDAYRRQDWDQAEACFREVLAVDSQDQPSRLFLKRIADFREKAPPENWQGVTAFLRK